MSDGARVDFWFLATGQTIPGIIIGRRQSCLYFYKTSIIRWTTHILSCNVVFTERKKRICYLKQYCRRCPVCT
jgi:hypothetical protein